MWTVILRTEVSSAPHWRTVVNWFSSANDRFIHLRCAGPGGTPADARFTVLFTASSGGPLPPEHRHAGRGRGLRGAPDLQLTGYGNQPGYRAIGTWSNISSNELLARVNCFDAAGAYANQSFLATATSRI